MQVAKRVNYKDKVHAGDQQEVQEAVEQGTELLRMDEGSQDEGTTNEHEENGRRRADSILNHLSGNTNDNQHL